MSKVTTHVYTDDYTQVHRTEGGDTCLVDVLDDHGRCADGPVRLTREGLVGLIASLQGVLSDWPDPDPSVVPYDDEIPF